MAHNNNPIERGFRSSQLYKALKKSGFVGGAIADTLGAAAQGADIAFNAAADVGSGVAEAARSVKEAVANPGGQRRNAQNPPPQQGRSASPNPGGQVPPQQQRPAQQQRPPQPRGPQPQRPPQQPQRPNQPAGNAQPPAPNVKLVRKPSVARYYITAAVAFILAMNMPLYEWYHLLIFAAVLALVFLGCTLGLKGKPQWVPIAEPPKERREEKKPEEKRPQPSSTGNPEVDKIIADGEGYLRKLRELNDAIPDESLSESISRMERASADIFRYISDHPEKAPQIRKFMNYYLPTTLKLLNTYKRLASQSVKGENITSTMFNISGMMHTVALAFEKQLDSLFSEEAMDVSADISVFETLLKQEGFVDDDDRSIPKN